MTRKDDARNRQIIRLYKLGFSPTDIADELDLTRDLVNGIVRRAGIYKVKTKIIDDMKAYKRRSIRYWADLYGVPLNVCYEAVRKFQDIGKEKKTEVGSPRLLTEREFLSLAVYTTVGKKIVSKMLQKGLLLTANEIRDNIMN